MLNRFAGLKKQLKNVEDEVVALRTDLAKEVGVCPKCKGSRMVDDSGLFFVVALMGKPLEREPRTYPCPRCCPELHEAVVAEYKKLITERNELIVEQTFHNDVCEILRGCHYLPVGETWASTKGGVLQYIRDIVNALNEEID